MQRDDSTVFTLSFEDLKISPEIVAKLCFDRFKQLPKTGKPNNNEWTVLAGVVLHNKHTSYSQVVSLGCGTKCIGKSKLCSRGLILNDSHAEILARRGLLRYLYNELKEALAKRNGDDKDCIFKWLPEKHKFQLKDHLTLHFLSTQTPCGDACIIDAADTKDFMDVPGNKRRKIEKENNQYTDVVGSIVDSVYTGAKLIGSNHADAMEQLLGAVRTKPGRGERTLSMSCSDKLAKWQIMGIQGALLDNFLSEPLYFSTLNFWGKNSIESLKRAIWERFEGHSYENLKYRLHIPDIRICEKPEFPYAQDITKQPSPNGLVWCNVPENFRPYEISVNGKRQGVTAKKLHSPLSALKISKYFLLKEFLEILKMEPSLLPIVHNIDDLTYLDFKLLAKDYQTAWSEVKRKYFKQWTQKPSDILKFSFRDNENETINL